MKKSTHILLGLMTCWSLNTAFAQILDPSITGGAPEQMSSTQIMSSEATTGSTTDLPALNSAGDQTMSDEVNITIPFNAAEVDKPTAWTPDVPQGIHLNSATRVATGPEWSILLVLLVSLGISGTIYVRAKPFLK